ncbi:2Fe-2S iron-sulfur cluster-binding protein [Streptomyces lavendulae]|uniref:2Fe-2S iron-sulfur cluster-binding protein n=1 Tax=Streptomyces lavendulae TaxID=1914 RepID=UPI0036EEC098
MSTAAVALPRPVSLGAAGGFRGLAPAGAGATSTVGLTVNGERRSAVVDNRTSLLDSYGKHLGLPGTKKGCDQGACGACTPLAVTASPPVGSSASSAS